MADSGKSKLTEADGVSPPPTNVASKIPRHFIFPLDHLSHPLGRDFFKLLCKTWQGMKSNHFQGADITVTCTNM